MKRSMYAGRVREEHIGQEMTLKDGLAVVVTLVVWSLSTFVTVKELCSWLSTLKKYLQRLWQRLKAFAVSLSSR